MTVKELIHELLNHPMDAEVHIDDPASLSGFSTPTHARKHKGSPVAIPQVWIGTSQ